MPCNTFQHLAADIWTLIERSRVAGMRLKEETLTDLNMLHLKLAHPRQVIIKTFNKIEEGTTGADWEWWFRLGSRWIGFRVQAKILDIRDDSFHHLHYPVASPAQCDKLIAQSRIHPARIPLY